MRENTVIKLPLPRKDMNTPEYRAAICKANVAWVRKRLGDTSDFNVSTWIKIGETLLDTQRRAGASFRSLFAKNIKEQSDETKFPFSRATGQMFVDIAKAFQVANNVGHLPISWGTLHILSKLSAPKVEQYVSSGAIHPLMTRAEANKLVNPRRAKKSSKVWSTNLTQNSAKEQRVRAVLALIERLGLSIKDLA